MKPCTMEVRGNKLRDISHKKKVANLDKKVADVCDKLNIVMDDQIKLKEDAQKYRSKSITSSNHSPLSPAL